MSFVLYLLLQKKKIKGCGVISFISLLVSGVPKYRFAFLSPNFRWAMIVRPPGSCCLSSCPRYDHSATSLCRYCQSNQPKYKDRKKRFREKKKQTTKPETNKLQFYQMTSDSITFLPCENSTQSLSTPQRSSSVAQVQVISHSSSLPQTDYPRQTRAITSNSLPKKSLNVFEFDEEEGSWIICRSRRRFFRGERHQEKRM